MYWLLGRGGCSCFGFLFELGLDCVDDGMWVREEFVICDVYLLVVELLG